MTALLERALAEISKLPPPQQEEVAGVLEGDDIIWFWVGSHDEYERLINQP